MLHSRKVNGKDKLCITRFAWRSFYTNKKDCLCIHVPFLPHPIITNDIVEWLSETEFIWKGRFITLSSAEV